MRNIKVSQEDFDTLYMQESYAGTVSGLEFVATQSKDEYDNHGGALFLLIVKKASTGVLYAGEFAVDTGEGDVYEYPEKFYPVTAQERTVVVTDYVPIS